VSSCTCNMIIDDEIHLRKLSILFICCVITHPIIILLRLLDT